MVKFYLMETLEEEREKLVLEKELSVN